MTSLRWPRTDRTQAQESTRYRRCVASGVPIPRTISSSTRSAIARTACARHRTTPAPSGSAARRAHPPPERSQPSSPHGRVRCDHRPATSACAIATAIPSSTYLTNGHPLGGGDRRATTDYEDRHAVVNTTQWSTCSPMLGPERTAPVSLISSRTCWPTPGGSCNCVSGPGPEARPNQSCKRMKPSPPGCQACRGGLRCTRRPTSTCRARNETEDGTSCWPDSLADRIARSRLRPRGRVRREAQGRIARTENSGVWWRFVAVL